MSEKKNGSSKKGASTLVATVIVAIAAVAAIVVLIMMTRNTDSPQKLPDGTEVTFKPSAEFVDECGANAQALMEDNYKVVRMFVSEGLPHLDEPYGNAPEDGLYTVNSDDFKTYAELEVFIKSVYTAEEAERILTRMPSDPGASADGAEDSVTADTSEVSRPEFIAIYAAREIYADSTSDTETAPTESKVPDVVIPESTDSGEVSKPAEPSYTKRKVLGINEYFKPYTAYNKPWGSISIRIVPMNEDECHITVYLGADKDVDLSSVEDSDILNTKMVKVDGEWRLTELVY